MQIYRLNKSSELKTRAIIISHMDLDGIMSAFLCDKAVRGLKGYAKDQVQVVGEYSPEPKSTIACLKQVLYKLRVDDELTIFILDRSNIRSTDINKLLDDNWLKPNWKIICIDHHNTNFKQEEYENTIIRVAQLVDDRYSAAMNVVNYFSEYGFDFGNRIREITRLTSIYDRFAWLTEKISKEDEKNAKFLNRVCGIHHRNEFIKMIQEKSLEDILKLGEQASQIASICVNKIYLELLDDSNDFLIHTFEKKNESINVVFIRRHIEYIYVSELSEYIFDNNNDIHVICYIDPTLGSVALRSRESGKYLSLADMISSLGLKGGGHPGAGGYYINRDCDKKELIDKLYYDQSNMLTNFISDLQSYFKLKDEDDPFNYTDGKLFYGFDESCKNYLDKLIEK